MNPLERPTAKQFFDPLVKVLGRLTNFTPYIGVPYKSVLDPVLREVGIDPENSPWPLRGSKPLGLYRIIGFAHRNQRPDLVSNKSGREVRYSGHREAFCLGLGRGLWGLTESGVERANYLLGRTHKRASQEVVEVPSSPPIDLPKRGSTSTESPSKALDRTVEALVQAETRDTRDRPTWVVVELNPAGEAKVDEGTLEDALRRDLDTDEDHPVFVPAVTYQRTPNSRPITKTLMQGYAFAATGLDEIRYFRLETKTNYVNQVMSSMGSNGIRVLHVVPDVQIEAMRKQLRSLTVRDLSEGDLARVVEGRLKGLTVRVVELLDGGEVVVMTVGLRSLKGFLCLPRIVLAVEDDEGEAVGV